MCGIAGFINYTRSKFDAREVATTLQKKLDHRGPDDKGVLILNQDQGIVCAKEAHQLPGGDIGLVHTRLSILDLSEHGWQPMISNDRQYAVTYNGEIYNFIELRKELIDLGYTFTSHTDTEVLLVAYQQWGKLLLAKLKGMFAFAILDLKEGKLFCARDHFGIKPFYYTLNDSLFAFASETKALLDIPGVSSKANLQVTYDYLCQGRQEPTDATFFRDIKALPPGHYIEINFASPGSFRRMCYWTARINRKPLISYQEATETLQELFKYSVGIHMRSDVPIAANLSGGIDSSSIVMMMREIGGTELDLTTISYIADQESISEEKWIDIVNNASKANPHKIKPSATELTNELDELIKVQDEPVGSSSAFAQYRVFKAIKQAGIKVVLDGQGADELLAGYRSYIVARLASLIRQRKVFSATRFLFNAMRLPGMANVKYLYTASKGLSRLSQFIFDNKGAEVSSGPSWLNWEFFAKENIVATPAWHSSSKELMLDQLLYTFKEASLPHLLRVADRNSMAHSVESRLPFLIPEIAEFIFSLPEEYILNSKAITKSVFRDSMAGHVPSTILKRKDKIGFTTPEQQWLREHSQWLESILTSDAANDMGFFNSAELISEWRSFLSGQAHFDWRFWRFINIIRWTEAYGVTYV